MDVVGIDIGFGFTKATNGKEFVVFKSLLGEATDIQFRMSMGKAENRRSMHVVVNGQSYFVGDFAEQQSNVRHFTLDQQQLLDEMARVLALTAMGHLVDGYGSVNLISGLPVGYYRDFHQPFSKMLTGSHEVAFQMPDGSQEVRKLNVGKVRIIPQPLGSVLNLLMNEHGKITNRDLAKQKIGVIDIGFRTTDFCIFDRMQYVERGSSTTDTGISKSFAIIAKKLREECRVNVELFRLFPAVESGFIKVRGKEYRIAQLRDLVFANAASTIAGDAERLWADDWDMDAVVVTGGGATELAEHIRPHIEGNVLPIEPTVDARLNNVQGYQKYALYLWGGVEAQEAS